jgi:quercetin dioxygenase-like cupin family protein
MYMTSVDATEPLAGPDGVTPRRLLDASSGLTSGMVEIIDLEPGASIPLHRHGNVEEASIVIDGDATLLTADGEQDAPVGTVFFSPPGVWHGLRAGDGPVRLFTALAGVADPAELDHEDADGEVSGPAPATVLREDAEDIRLDDASQGFYKLNARWLVSGETLGSSQVCLGSNAFDAEVGLHTLHRHPGAEEFLYIVTGAGANYAPDSETPIGAGEISTMPAGEWHGFRNAGSEQVTGIFGYFGASSLEDGGYELHPNGE